MSELLMFIGLSIFMIVMFVLFVAGAVLLAPFILLIIVITLIVLAIDKIKDKFKERRNIK